MGGRALTGGRTALPCGPCRTAPVQESKQHVGPRGAVFIIKKKETGPYWPRLIRDAKKPHWLQTDFSKWKDEDDDDLGGGDDDFPGMGGMDFSNFGGAGVRARASGTAAGRNGRG